MCSRVCRIHEWVARADFFMWSNHSYKLEKLYHFTCGTSKKHINQKHESNFLRGSDLNQSITQEKIIDYCVRLRIKIKVSFRLIRNKIAREFMSTHESHTTAFSICKNTDSSRSALEETQPYVQWDWRQSSEWTVLTVANTTTYITLVTTNVLHTTLQLHDCRTKGYYAVGSGS